MPGSRPGLDRVNVEMVCARMIWIARHDEAQRVENFLRLRLGRAVARPVIPRHRVHERLGEEHLRIEVVGILFCQFAHGVSKRLVQREPVILVVALIPLFQRRDVSLFLCGAL